MRGRDTERVLLVAGARPNFVKLAPLDRAFRAAGIEPVLVHTGQHDSEAMSGRLWRELGLPPPDHELRAGSDMPALMRALHPVMEQEPVDWVVVVGDVTSTLAAGLVAQHLRKPVAHVEAGLRSGDWSMPEELNRVYTDRLATALLTPSTDASRNLEWEGARREWTIMVGNVMVDSLLRHRREAGPPLHAGRYAVATLHRPCNVDEREPLARALTALAGVAEEVPTYLVLHPRTESSIERHRLGDLLAPFKVLPPLGYLEMLGAMAGAWLVLTDSGGVQEETTALGVPCVTLRPNTERPVTITHGTNRLAPWPLTAEGLVGCLLDRARSPEPIPGWDGWAAERCVDALRMAA